MNRVLMAIRCQDTFAHEILATHLSATADLLDFKSGDYLQVARKIRDRDFKVLDSNPNFLASVAPEFLAMIGVNFLEIAKRYRIEVTDYYSQLQEMSLCETIERLQAEEEAVI